MRFSIVIGTYNQIETLPKLVESLDNQTFKDFEVLFCNDGSTDGTKEYLAEMKATFPFRVFTQKNKGMRLSKNLNQGIKESLGEYCVFIMGDSFPEMDYLETLNDIVDTDRLVCGIRIQVDNGKGVDIDYRFKKGLVPQEQALLLKQPWSLATGNGLTIPTEAMKKYGMWNEGIEGYGGDDNEIIARLYFKGYTVYSDPNLRLYHNWHKSKAGENNKKVIELINSYAR